MTRGSTRRLLVLHFFMVIALLESNSQFGLPTQGQGGNSGAGGTAFQPRVMQLGFRATF
jgi:hypothetical protein